MEYHPHLEAMVTSSIRPPINESHLAFRLSVTFSDITVWTVTWLCWSWPSQEDQLNFRYEKFILRCNCVKLLSLELAWDGTYSAVPEYEEFMFVNLLKLFGMSDSFPKILGTTPKVVAKCRLSPHLKKKKK